MERINCPVGHKMRFLFESNGLKCYACHCCKGKTGNPGKEYYFDKELNRVLTEIEICERKAR